MRVVHVIKATRISGAERHLLTLLPAMVQRGLDVHLLLLLEPDKPMAAFVAQAEAGGIHVQRLLIRRDYDVRLIYALRKRLRTLEPDVVHTHLIHADVLAIPAARLAGVPVIITGRHNDDAFRRRLLIRTLNRRLWRSATAGIAISDAIRQFAAAVERAPAARIHVVHYGIDYASLSPQQISSARADLRQMLGVPDDALLLGTAARLIQQKGLSYALRALGQIKADYPHLYYVIAGEGPLQDALEKEARRLGLQRRVIFLGWREDVLDIMAGLDVFLLPSLWEGLGLVLLEAMSRRLPIVASDVSAIPEVVTHGETGILVPPGQPAPLAEALRQLLDDAPLRRHMGLLGEDRLETHFSSQRMIDETLTIYRDLCAHSATTAF
jgi:glycosyltransferase involved in cell wall biosynthesis